MGAYVFKGREAALSDLEMLANAADTLRQALVNWRALESIPAAKWVMYPAEKVSDDVLKIRKEHDRKKFSIPAEKALGDLNRCLVSLGLAELRMDEFVEEV